MSDFEIAEFATQIAELRHTITDEIFRVAGFSRRGWVRKIFGPLMFPPATRFAAMLAEFDLDVANRGYREAISKLLERFVTDVRLHGTENIPTEGPLVVASNHPGTYDGLAILSGIPRNDMKLVVQNVPFARNLQASSPHLIYTPSDLYGRMGVVRSMIRHLNDGGGLLIFPSGKLDPDPKVLPGAMEALSEWSPSIEFVLRKVPDTQVLVTIVSGVLAQSSLESLMAKFFDDLWMRLRVAEFTQIVRQLFTGKTLDLVPEVSFGDPISFEDILRRINSQSVMNEIIGIARELMEKHTGLPPFDNGW